MISPHLKLEVRWYPVEDDGTEGRLTATAASDAFWGRGHGEIERKWLVTFADALSAYPISADRLGCSMRRDRRHRKRAAPNRHERLCEMSKSGQTPSANIGKLIGS
jgi:hypothetical protein